MNYKELKKRRVKEIASDLIKGKSVKPWLIQPYKKELIEEIKKENNANQLIEQLNYLVF